MLEKIIDYLQRKEWTFIHGKYPKALSFNIKGFNASFNCLVDVSDDFFLCITFNGTICPIDKRLQLSELFTRINSNLKYGNFEMGMDSGEIKFRTCICSEGIEINDTVIENVIMRNINVHDFSFLWISKFLFGEKTSMSEIYNDLFPPLEELESKEVKQIEG